MARLVIEEAAITIGRPPETIERWILDGRVEAERDGADWLVDLRSLLNAATAAEASAGGNGVSGDHAAHSPVDQPDDLGGRAAPPHEATAAVAIAEPPTAPPDRSGAPPPDAAGRSPDPAPGSPEVPSPPGDAGLATTAEPERTPRAHRPSEPTVEIASTAIAALSARLEQAMSEIDRLHDERLKLALQLGYAQAQLRTCNDQLRMLTAPPEPSPLVKLWRRLTGRGETRA
ncbi:MAG TPA: hypothetical protein VG370_04665 [Chloroflexota bacterium]|jgi:hypothetical protein|nr:hypothetical protein [Chloroflexota bacterium]